MSSFITPLTPVSQDFASSLSNNLRKASCVKMEPGLISKSPGSAAAPRSQSRAILLLPPRREPRRSSPASVPTTNDHPCRHRTELQQTPKPATRKPTVRNVSSEGEQEYSPCRKAWVGEKEQISPEGAKESRPAKPEATASAVWRRDAEERKQPLHRMLK